MSKYQRPGRFFGQRRKRAYHRRNDEMPQPKISLAFWSELSPEVKKGLLIIFLFVIAVLSVLGLFDLSGQFGRLIAYVLAIFLGNAKWLVPLILGAWVFFLLNEEKYPLKIINHLGAFLLTISLAGLFHLSYDSWEALEMAKLGRGGGYVGALLVLLLFNLLGFWGTLVVLIAMFLVGILLALETSIYGLMWPWKLLKFLFGKASELIAYIKSKQQERQLRQMPDGDNYEEENLVTIENENIEEENLTEDEDDTPRFIRTAVSHGFQEKLPEKELVKPKKFGKRIELPVNLVNTKSGKPTSGDIKNNQEIIRKTLANFGIAVEMGDVNIGPTVTQYTLRPADGMKLSRLVNLGSDLALALAAHPIRIEAPIPGKALVGIEIPNQMSAKVSMGEMLLSKEYKDRGHNLALALGKDVSGKACFIQLDKMPHILIAGATGSGKSVCVNSIIVSLLYQNSPDELKFILVDPKRVELPHYNGIPYLLTPVITDVKKTVGALKWSITEMERRFELLSKMGHRNIASYNQVHSGDKLPYIVIVIDELAELMASNPNDMEAGIVRLAQMARAVGIHLVLATQRPSTEVITGLIKANIPARMSFAVASSIDSRTILDGTGAEKLVGRGDMLFLSPEISKPKRIQGVFLSDQEINNIINYIKNQSAGEWVDELASASNGSGGFGGSGGGFSDDDGDPLLNEAVDVIRQSGKASASLLQRRLKLGYARAARILDLLEDKGIIGAADGAKPREVFLDKLGGVGAVEFAAREHDLTGELKSFGNENEEDEPSFTAFTRDEQPVNVFSTEEENSADEIAESDESLAEVSINDEVKNDDWPNGAEEAIQEFEPEQTSTTEEIEAVAEEIVDGLMVEEQSPEVIIEEVNIETISEPEEIETEEEAMPTFKRAKISAKKNDKPMTAKSSGAAKTTRGFFDEDEWS